ncbi:MAG: putative Ig domain-containing protein [Gammaproteobacteria bacterium]
MLNNLNRIVIMFVMMLLLGACSGGGGGGDAGTNRPSNNAPTISGSPDATAVAGSAYAFTPTANDADGDTLTFSVTSAPSWATFSTSDGSLTGTPQADDVGVFNSISIRVSDGTTSTTLAAFTITVQAGSGSNTAPTISGTPVTSATVGALYSFTPTASDADNDALSYQISGMPTWATFNASTGSLTGTPGQADAGTTSTVTISVSDGTDTSSLPAFVLTVNTAGNNSAPTISGTPDASVAVGMSYSFTPTSTDADGDALTFSVQNLPSWASFSATTGALTGTPAQTDAGQSQDITISVSDGTQSVSLAAFSITVVPATGNSAPTISGTPPATLSVGDNYLFIPTAADADGDDLVFGVFNLPGWASFNSKTGTIFGVPDGANVGVYNNIMIFVSDGQASAQIAPFSITVQVNSPPTITGSAPTQVTAGDAYVFTPASNDAEGDALAFTIQNSPSWASFDPSNGRLSGTPQNADAGVYGGIVIAVSDGESTIALAPFSIAVNGNTAPVLVGTPADTLRVGEAYSFTPVATDPDGDALTFSLLGRPSWASFNTATGALTGTPAAGDVGVYSGIVITVSDSRLTTSLPTFSIEVTPAGTVTISGTPDTQVNARQDYLFRATITNPNGVAVTFSISNLPSWASFSAPFGILSGTPANGDEGLYSNIVISVDDGTSTASLPAFDIRVNPSGSPEISGTPATSVAVGDTYSFTPTASDPEDDPLTFSIAQQPAWASFNTGTGALTGTPTQADAGTYAGIVISVTDGSNIVSLPAFAIDVDGNVAPTISGTPATTVRVGDAYSFAPVANDDDGDALTFSIQNKPSWASFSTVTGNMGGSPLSGSEGTYSGIVISVSDGAETASLPAFAVTVQTNGDPVIGGTPASSVDVGSAYSFVPTASDPEGETLTFGITNRPSWAQFSTTTGALTGTPDAGDVGTYANIRIRVTDDVSITFLPAFSIEVNGVNTAPTISGAPATEVTVGSNYAFTPTAVDLEGDALTFSIDNRPDWASFDIASGRLSGTPDANDVGSYTGIVIRVSDGDLSDSLPAFSVTVAATNEAPTISGTPPSQVSVGELFSFTPTIDDPDGDTLTLTIFNRPSWATFNPTTGRLSGTPGAGDVAIYSNIRIQVSDGSQSSTLGPFPVEVVASGTGSATLSWTPPTEYEDGSALVLGGYKFFWGTSVGNYTNEIQVDNPGLTMYVIEDLTPGTWFFVAKAIDDNGVESTFTPVASKDVTSD